MKKLMMLAAMVALVAAVGVVPALANTNGLFGNGLFDHGRNLDNGLFGNNGNGFNDPFGNGFFGDGGGNGGGPSISQDVQPQSGDVALNNEVSNTGSYSSQCTPALQNGNTGNFTNSPAVLQYGGRSGAIEPEGVQVDFGGGSVSADCPSTIEQSSAASSTSDYYPSDYSSGYNPSGY